jgi:hypothetical protein
MLAKDSGLGMFRLTAIEEGLVDVSLHEIVRLAAALNKDPGVLVRGITDGPRLDDEACSHPTVYEIDVIQRRHFKRGS